MRDKTDVLFVAAASYENVDAAVDDYESIKDLYYEVKSSDDFDAAVIAKDENGKVDIVKKHEQPTRHGAAHGLGWGLAAGAVAALFPAVGIVGALTVGGGAGAIIGRLTHRAASGISREDLKQLGEVLDSGHAGLVVVYGVDMADRVSGTIERATSRVRATTDVSTEQLAADLREAETAAGAPTG